MPVFDTPIHTNDDNLKKVLAQNLPVLLYLYDSRQKPDGAVADAVNTVARKHAGAVLIAQIDIATNPKTYQEYGRPTTPAVVGLAQDRFHRKVKSQADNVRPGDVRAHVAYLLDKGPLPTPAAKPAPPPANASGGKVEHVTDANFKQKVLNSKVPVLVDFWAPWCGPCRMIAPVVEQLAKDYAGQVKMVKLNVDENPVTGGQFQVRSIPTLMIFRDGRLLERQIGANPQAIRQLIENALQPIR
ncbi:MAG TPA: thioredoxin [Phototrophicaceae bacterium]|nr:thioredoxin [Phototrophicaceae bacterium]